MATQPRVTTTNVDKGWHALVRLSHDLRDGAFAKVGILENAQKPEDDRFTMASLGAIHEFGSKDGTIPERSFIRAGIDKGRAHLDEVSRKVARGIYEGRFDVEQALGIVGLSGASSIRKYVTQGDQVPPPNAPATLKRKVARGKWKGLGPVDQAKLVRTLIDTGRMLGSITWAVVVGGSQKSIEPPPGAAS